MKRSRKVALVVGLAVGLTGVALGASRGSENGNGGTVSNRITNYCDSVCELQAQDSAFSLLIEAYREFQSRQIEVDYEARLRAVAGLGKDGDTLVIDTTLHGARTMRAWTEALAAKERDLRLEQLQTRVVNFASAYQCARKGDERALDEPVANQVDARAAARELKTWRVLALGSLTSDGFRTVVSKPATSLFLDSAPAEPWQTEVVGPCEDTTTRASAPMEKAR